MKSKSQQLRDFDLLLREMRESGTEKDYLTLINWILYDMDEKKIEDFKIKAIRCICDWK